jgi:hypothetical protein
LNRRAIGWDVLISPFNFLMGFPNFLLQVGALVLRLVRLHRWSYVLGRTHLGLYTEVQKAVDVRVMTDLLGLSDTIHAEQHPIRDHLRSLAQEPVRIYVQTRNVAADLTAGTFAAIAGILLLHQFTPGSISAGSALANTVAVHRAVAEFPLGETLGQLFYTMVPATPPAWMLAVTFLAVMVVIGVTAAFAGLVHDPLQAATGIHQRRLHRLLDAIEASAVGEAAHGYRPRDTFIGRVYDAIDWIKGLFPF